MKKWMKISGLSMISILTSATSLFAISGASAATAAEKASHLNFRLGVVLKTLSNPYWVAMKDGVEAEAKKLGVKVDIQAATTEGSISGQVNILNTMENKNYNAYIVAPITGNNLIPQLQTLTHNHVPIINVDSPVDPIQAKAAGVKLDTFISSNNFLAGEIAGSYLAKILHHKGQVAVVEGLAGDATSQARMNGFDKAATAGGLKVVTALPGNWDRLTALNDATEIMSAHPQLRGFYACNDDMALGVFQAVKNVHKTGSVKVVGTDGILQSMQSIASGGMAGTVSQYPFEEGVLSVQAAVDVLEGKKIPSQISSPIQLITRANAKAAIKKFPAPFVPFKDPLPQVK